MIRAASIEGDATGFQPVEGGSTPTAALSRHEWRVAPMSFQTAQEWVRKHHYSRGGSNTRCYVLGVMSKRSPFEADAVGVSWWIPPTKTCGGSVWPLNPQAVLSLSRLVCVPSAPKNTPSFMLAHCHRFIDRVRWPIWITFADSWQGHSGGIYKAAGWIECGRTKPEATYVKDGRMVCRKSGPKTRTHDEMIAKGCEFVGRHSRVRFVNVRNDLREVFEPIRQRLTAPASAAR